MLQRLPVLFCQLHLVLICLLDLVAALLLDVGDFFLFVFEAILQHRNFVLQVFYGRVIFGDTLVLFRDSTFELFDFLELAAAGFLQFFEFFFQL